MSSEASQQGPWRTSFAGQVTYRPTGESYGIGGKQSGVIHASLLLEGNHQAVVGNLSSYWALFEFDLPTKLPLGDERWSIPYEETTLHVRLLPKTRGEELWSSLDTTTLPEFTRVSIKASPTFLPDRIRPVAEVVLENVELLLAAANRSPLPAIARQRLSLRAYFYERPFRNRPVLAATVPLTDEVRYDSPTPVPITAEILERLDEIRSGLVRFVSESEQPTSFGERVLRIVHDFSFFGRQHAGALSRLREEVLRDFLLMVFKHFFPAEGEAFNHRGKTDIKVVNPENRYEFAVVELKFWRDRESINELMRQASAEHVTGQESLIICQILSRNKEFGSVVDTIRSLIESHAAVESLIPFSHRGTSEVLFRSSIHVRGREVPFLVSCVDLYSWPS
jgi:hypothetical protein